MRAYTVAEIDRMRDAVWPKVAKTRFCWATGELDKAVEERLRTYLLASVEPDDLCGVQPQPERR